ncbi:MAG: hypothetical protein AB7N76_25835 [Planctomycetota bacterium]
MAKAESGLPDALERRNVLYGVPKRAPDYAKLGQRYAAAGRKSDALECFEKVTDQEQRRALIKGVQDEALKQGDYFLLNRTHNQAPLGPSDWLAAARNAREAGKLRYALKAAERAVDDGLVSELKAALGIVEPAAEAAEDEVVDEAALVEAADAADAAAAAGDAAPAAEGDTTEV